MTRWVDTGAVEEVCRVLEGLEELDMADLLEHVPNAGLHPEPQYEDFEPHHPYCDRELASMWNSYI
jgi:hypothetical protein